MKEANTPYEFPTGEDKTVVESLEGLVVFVANRFVQKHNIFPYEVVDLYQFVRLRLIESLGRIRTTYKGGGKVKTYISAVILNFCREFRRKNCTISVFADSVDNLRTDISINELTQSPDSRLHITLELKRLHSIFVLYGAKEHKVRITLMVYFEVHVKKEDVMNYVSAEVKSNQFFKQLNSGMNKSKKEVISKLTEMFNEVENKSNSFEATRKWIARLIDDVLQMLNVGASLYTKETLGILLEVYSSTDKQMGYAR